MYSPVLLTSFSGKYETCHDVYLYYNNKFIDLKKHNMQSNSLSQPYPPKVAKKKT